MLSRYTLNGRTMTVGDEVRHFKGKFYTIKGFALHTETGEMYVVYMAEYDVGTLYCRPAEMFFSEVNKEKYPNVKQRYRFEVV